MSRYSRRDYLADHDCRVVLRLAPVDGPTLEDLAAALDRPARPLFIGRKPCLPLGPIFAVWVDAEDARAALASLGIAGRAIWRASEGDLPDRARQVELADLRNWRSGPHGGARIVVEGRRDMSLAAFRRTRVPRGGRRFEGPDAVFQGALTVENLESFVQLLARGVGRHRAYGYGRRLLRPPQQRSG